MDKLEFENRYEELFSPRIDLYDEQILIYFDKETAKYVVISLETAELLKEVKFIALKNCSMKNGKYVGYECLFSEIWECASSTQSRINLKTFALYASFQLTENKKPKMLFWG